jgi:hypothetical protein
MFKSGLAIHCHHDILVECCYNYDERVEVIKSTKPQNEQEIRLRLFKLLPKEAIDELPYEMVKAWAEWDKAWAEWVKAQAGLDKAQAELDKAQAEWVKACAERDKAQAGLDKAWAEWDKACAEWDKADRDNWHKKWCGCKEWNGKEIEFK